MSIEIGWAGLGIIIAILSHAAFTIWYAASFKATVSSKIDNLILSLSRIDKELEKRDAQIAAAWKKIDEIKDRITRIESARAANVE